MDVHPGDDEEALPLVGGHQRVVLRADFLAADDGDGVEDDGQRVGAAAGSQFGWQERGQVNLLQAGVVGVGGAEVGHDPLLDLLDQAGVAAVPGEPGAEAAAAHPRGLDGNLLQRHLDTGGDHLRDRVAEQFREAGEQFGGVVLKHPPHLGGGRHPGFVGLRGGLLGGGERSRPVGAVHDTQAGWPAVSVSGGGVGVLGFLVRLPCLRRPTWMVAHRHIMRHVRLRTATGGAYNGSETSKTRGYSPGHWDGMGLRPSSSRI